MMRKLICAIALLTSTIHASAILAIAVSTEAERVILTSEDYNVLKDEVVSIYSYSKHRMSKNLEEIDLEPVKEINCDINSNPRYRFDITPILPSQLLKLHNTLSPYEGPNCVNAVFYIDNEVRSHRGVDFEEAKILLDQNYVENKMENGAPGDIGVIYNKVGGLPPHNGGCHYFTSLGKEICFEKRGYRKKDLYRIVTKQEILHGWNLVYEFDEKSDKHLYRNDETYFGIKYFSHVSKGSTNITSSLINAESKLLKYFTSTPTPEELNELEREVFFFKNEHASSPLVQLQVTSILNQIKTLRN